MSNIVNPAFDYSQIETDDAKKLTYFEKELSRSRKRVTEEIIKHGEVLHGAQQVLADYSGGMFRAWLDSQGLSKSSAYNAISAYVEFGSCPNLDNLEVSAIYELTKNEKAKKKALKLASKGIKVTHAAAKELVAECEARIPEPAPAPSQPDPIPSKESDQEWEDFDEDEHEADTPSEPPPTIAQKPPAKIGEDCPNCSRNKWRDGKCVKCGHFRGEPVGDRDQVFIDERLKIARSYAGNLIRAIDDAKESATKQQHERAIKLCGDLIDELGAWK